MPKIVPLRNMLLVRFRASQEETKSGLMLVRDPRTVRPAEVEAVGVEVRDVKVGETVLVNVAAATSIGDSLLLPESSVLGALI